MIGTIETAIGYDIAYAEYNDMKHTRFEAWSVLNPEIHVGKNSDYSSLGEAVKNLKGMASSQWNAARDAFMNAYEWLTWREPKGNPTHLKPFQIISDPQIVESIYKDWDENEGSDKNYPLIFAEVPGSVHANVYEPYQLAISLNHDFRLIIDKSGWENCRISYQPTLYYGSYVEAGKFLEGVGGTPEEALWNLHGKAAKYASEMKSIVGNAERFLETLKKRDADEQEARWVKEEQEAAKERANQIFEADKIWKESWKEHWEQNQLPDTMGENKVEEHMKLPDDFQINYPYDHEPNYPNEVSGIKVDEGWDDYVAKYWEKAAKEAVKNGKETSFVAAGNGKEKELTIGKFFKNLKKCDKTRNKQAAKTKKAFEKVEKKKENGKQNHF